MAMQIMTEEQSKEWHQSLDEWWGTLGWNTKEAVRRLLWAHTDDVARGMAPVVGMFFSTDEPNSQGVPE